MTRIRSVATVILLIAVWYVAVPVAQDARPPTAQVSLTPSEMESFLLKAKIVRTRGAGGGTTNSLRATLSDGNLTHDAQIQTIDDAKLIFRPRGAPAEMNFTDSFRFNIAGYRLAMLLGLDNVPVSVERTVDGKRASMTWWIDDVMMDEKARLSKKTPDPDSSRTAMQIHIMRVFDELIQNRDRNVGNLLWSSTWKMWMIDHTRSFRTGDQLMRPQLLERVERSLWAGMKELTEERLKEAVGRSLTEFEIEALLKRRDRIVTLMQAKIAERGETAILYTMPRRP